MYAIIQHGSHQYRADEKGILRVQKIAAEPGEAVIFDQVLALLGEPEVKIGAPYVEGARVTGTVIQQGRGPKIRIMKFKKKKHYKKQAGHRQSFTAVRIEEIAG
jgi:large subunit ribosomal protein L21